MIKKWVKVIASIVVIAALANLLFDVFGSHRGHSSPTNPVSNHVNIIKRAEVVDYKMVIKSLSQLGQVVGMEGKIAKSYTYKDSMFKSHNMILNWLGEREYTLDTSATFKMGINVGDIQEQDVVISKDTIVVYLPKPVLISLEVPYDQVGVRTDTGLLRHGLSESDKQIIYGQVTKSLRSEIMVNKDASVEARKGVQKALDDVLSMIPNVQKVMFISKV